MPSQIGGEVLNLKMRNLLGFYSSRERPRFLRGYRATKKQSHTNHGDIHKTAEVQTGPSVQRKKRARGIPGMS